MTIKGIFKDAQQLAEQSTDLQAVTASAVIGLVVALAVGTPMKMSENEFNAQLDKIGITISEQDGWNYKEPPKETPVSAGTILAFNKSAQLKSFVQGAINNHQAGITVHPAVAEAVALELTKAKEASALSKSALAGLITMLAGFCAPNQIVNTPRYIPEAIRRRYDTPEANLS